jgi:hypothetical protein
MNKFRQTDEQKASQLIFLGGEMSEAVFVTSISIFCLTLQIAFWASALMTSTMGAKTN